MNLLKLSNYLDQKWNSRWFVLYGNNARGRVRLEYYDNEKSWQQEKGKRIIPLVHCVSIKHVWNKDYSHVLEIVTSDKTFFLGAGTKEEEKSWFKSLCKVVFGNANRNSIVTVLGRPEPYDMGYHSLDRGEEATGSNSNLADAKTFAFAHSSPQLSRILGSTERVHNTSTHDPLSTPDPNNDSRNVASSSSCDLASIISFESGFDDGASIVSSLTEGPSTYHVSVRPTIASKEANMNGEYVLQITPLSLTLCEQSSRNTVAEWPIQHLRRYGRGRTKFSFEADDKCKSPIGVFTFNTMEGDAIFHLVDTYAKRLSSLQKRETKDKRVSFPVEPFRTLSDTKRRARSEGKLLLDKAYDSSSNSINDMDDSSEKISNVGCQAVFPSKSRACTLGVIQDHETASAARKALELGARPRTETVGSLEVRNNDKINISEDDLDDYGESTESIIDGPAIDDENEKESVEAASSNALNDLQIVTQLIPSKFEEGRGEMADVEHGGYEDESYKGKRIVVEEPAEEMLIADIPKTEFEPLSTSEPAQVNKHAITHLGQIVDDQVEKTIIDNQDEDKLASDQGENNVAGNGVENNLAGDQVENTGADEEISNAITGDQIEEIKTVNQDDDKSTDNEIENKIADSPGDNVTGDVQLDSNAVANVEIGNDKVNKDSGDNNSDSVIKSATSLEPEVNASAIESHSQPDAALQREAASSVPVKRKMRKHAYRNKSFELGTLSEKPVESRRTSGSFSFFDYRKYTQDSDHGHKKLNRFSSVKKTVEMYEKLSVAASESRLKGFTLWRRKFTRSSQKPDVVTKTAGGNV
eukprot:gene5410-6087_t